jgi:hypothetical protein
MAEPDRAVGAPSAPGLRLTCRPGKSGTTLLFPYTLENQGSVDVYAMHALPSVDPQSGEPSAKDLAPVVILGADGDAIIGKFAAPLPTDRRVAIPVMPLAQHLPAGGSLEGKIEVPLPLAEASPYFADLTLRQYDMVDIKGVSFTIGYWRADTAGLMAVPAEYAPGLFNVVTPNTLRSAQRIAQRFPTTGLQLFRRKDAFPRAFV